MIKANFYFLLLILVFTACSGPENKKTTEKPNIVIILTDDQGWGDLSATGNDNINTPNVDAIRQNGASLEHFYVSPVCSPTRAEMLTGRYHPRSNVFSTSAGGERMDLDETTFAELFQDAGYATGAFGKWHNGMQYPYHPNARGFDEFYGFCSGHWGNYFSPILEHNGKIVQGEGYLTNELTDSAMHFMEKNRNKSFLVYLPYNTPHSPMQVPDQWWNQFADKELEMEYQDPQKEDPRFTKAALAMCKNIDWNVGRIQNKLEDLGLTENTIVIYFSDNGPNSWRWNGGMRGKKGSIHEGGVRAPLFIQWPDKIPAGKKISKITAAIDLLPTLSDLAGIPADLEKPLDGKSLKPLLTENKPFWNDRMLYSHWRGRTSVRSQNYRLDHEGRLYHLKQHPGQKINVANENPDLASALRDSLSRWEEDVLSEINQEANRPFPIGHPDYPYTQIPARDGIPHGNIERSNRFPNCTFFRNWSSLNDSITWNAEVLEQGQYNVTLYYTCAPENVGSSFALKFKGNRLEGKITEAHDPPLEGMEHDRIERQESYVKDFKPKDLGTITLEKGQGPLTLKALEIPGKEVMNFRLMMFEREN